MATIADHMRRAAKEFANDTHVKIANLDKKLAEIQQQKKKIEDARNKASGALERAARFPVKAGAGYSCPSAG
jgi:hypothetical protein